MDAQQGAFFVIEGIDGSGKATQFAMLRDRLERAGYRVATFDFPQYDQESSHFIRHYLEGQYGSAAKVGPYAGSLFYALDRYEAAVAIRDALDKGYIVLANRFTGSNMANQGAKFTNSSERRGYYIWLDSLEFMVLNIPRPDLNLVLRVPAKIARALAEKRAELNYPGIPVEANEAEFAHIETSVLVYDELCQLFPKDFRQIDCVRSSALMAVEQIQQNLWETLQPYLPRVPTDSLAPLTVYQKAEINIETVAHDPPKKFTRISDVTAARIGLPVQPYMQERTKKKPYYIPATIKDDLRERYIEVMDSLFELHTEMQHRISPEFASHVDAVLPVSTLRSYTVSDVDYDTIAQLDTPEARIVRAVLQIKEHKGPSAFTRGNTIARMASDILPSSYAKQPNDEIRLVSVTPRNELDIVPLILYPSSELPLFEIANVTADWHYEQKSTIFLAYIATGNDASNALASISYVWDVTVPFITIRDLQGIAPNSNLSWQALSPRLGYEVPEAIEEAGLSDLYERSFDTSLELYSELQAAGLYQEAQYAILNGHQLRCVYQCNGWTLRSFKSNVHEIHPHTMHILNEIQQRAAQTHPLLGSDV